MNALQLALRGRSRRALLALLLAFVLLPSAPATAQTAGSGAKADLVDIEDEVMCIVCERPLSTSGGDAADDQRSVIQGFIDEGLTKQQVKDRLVAEYGEKVLVEGSSPVAAAAPVIAALVGGASVWLLLRRRLASAVRTSGPSAVAAGAGGAGTGGTGDDRDASPVGSAGGAAALREPSAEDDARIDAELSER